MKRRSSIAVFLKTLLAVAFVLASGSFSHSFADRPHDHAQEIGIGIGGGHTHDHVAPGADSLVADHETVHCGAYLLALTEDAGLDVPDLDRETVSISFATVASRVATIDPPPPRFLLLSI